MSFQPFRINKPNLRVVKSDEVVEVKRRTSVAEPDLAARIERIKGSIERINTLMQELKATKEEQNRGAPN